jgi:hypothetical protein
VPISATPISAPPSRPVDAGGIDVDYGLRHVPDAKPVVVTQAQRRFGGLIDKDAKALLAAGRK